jgi:redox-sensitive bicupin YhaK (pirin superfamily)
MPSEQSSVIPLDPVMSGAPEAIIVPRSRDLGDGFAVNRVLPATERRMVGPFVFFDHFGPTILRAGKGLDVRPHPHIGLATVTYLFAGEILHRDSLGTVQPIRPGEVNWMTAGRGIAHSERTPAELRVADSEIFGIQTWVGLPRDKEEVEPSFTHYAAQDLPILEGEGARIRLIAGEAYGARSPVTLFSATFYIDASLAPGARLAVPANYDERAAYIVSGAVEIASARFDAGRLLVFRKGDSIAIATTEGARLVLLGGEPMDGPRRVWWNFVSSSNDRIEQAKADWKAGRFTAVPGDAEFIPLPD